jgi:mannobiose 2-epimerase
MQVNCALAQEARGGLYLKNKNRIATMDAGKFFATLLHDNIFGFWNQMIDIQGGGFHSTKDNDGILVPSAERGLVQHARLVWSYSALYRMAPKDEYSKMARHACDYLLSRFRDEAGSYKGWYYQVDATGKPLDERYHMYAFSFVVYALAEYYRAFKDQKALDAALHTYELLETKAKDPVHGGYHETFTRNFEPLEQIPEYGTTGFNKTMNTHIHMMECYTTLYLAAPSAKVKQSLTALIDLCVDKIVDRQHNRLNLFFKPDWTPVPAHVSYGHDIEFSWLLWEAVEATSHRKKELAELVVKMADEAQKGLDPQKGGMFYDGQLADGKPYEFTKVWWVQAEALVGYLNAYLMTSEQKYLQIAQGVLRFILQYQIDYQGLEWFDKVHPDGRVGNEKASVWKVSYHTGRCLMMVYPHAELFSDLAHEFGGRLAK